MKKIKYLFFCVAFTFAPLAVLANWEGLKDKDGKVASIQKISKSSYEINIVYGSEDKKNMEFLIPAKCHHIIRNKIAETFCCTADETKKTSITLYSDNKKETKKVPTDKESFNFDRDISHKEKPFERNLYYPELCTWTDQQLIEYVNKRFNK